MGITSWITVRGNHIPIMDGESKASAVGRFIKERRLSKEQRLKNYYSKIDKINEKEGIEKAIEYGKKNYPIRNIYGTHISEVRKRNQEKYNELYNKHKDNLSKYSKEELLEMANNKIPTGDGERAYRKSWVQHDLANYKAKKDFMPERDKYRNKTYKLKEDMNFDGFEKAFNTADRVNKWYDKKSPNEEKYKQAYKKLVEQEYNAKTVVEKNKIIDKMNKIYAKAEEEGPKSARALQYLRNKYRKELKKKK